MCIRIAYITQQINHKSPTYLADKTQQHNSKIFKYLIGKVHKIKFVLTKVPDIGNFNSIKTFSPHCFSTPSI